MSIFRGSGVALVTPMKENGEINYDSLAELIESQIAGGNRRADRMRNFRRSADAG